MAKWFFVSTFTKYFVAGLGLLFAFLGLLLFGDNSSIVIQSRESKTADGSPVFNEILYEPGLKKDLWLMRQSHFGKIHPKEKWDRIAIVVNKVEKKAEFFQLKSGPLKWNGHGDRINYKVSCYVCHSNGPRAIRPDFKAYEVSLWNRLRIMTWNLRIKSYGRIESASLGDGVPFRLPGTLANETLKIKVCSQCHKENGFLARGALTRQHYLVIKFMLDNKIMPPLGIELSDEEKAQIYQFIGM